MKTLSTISMAGETLRPDRARRHPGVMLPGLLIAAVLLASIGCAGRRSRERRPPIPKGPVVTDVVIEGNQSFKDAELLRALATEETSNILFWEKKYLDPGQVDADQARLRTFYQMKGFFDVIVNPVRVIPSSEEYREPGADDRDDVTKPDKRLGIEQPVPGPKLEMAGSRKPGLELQEAPANSATTAPAGANAAPNAGAEAAPGGATGADGTTPAGGTAGSSAVPGGTPGSSAAPGQAVAGQPGALPPPTAAEELKKARVIFQVHEGNRYKVGEVRFEIDGDLPPALKEVLQGQIKLRQNQYFDLPLQQADERALLEALQKSSYAWAEVSGDIVIMPRGNLVRTRYHIKPGPACVFGNLQIEGLDQVQESIIIDRAERFIIIGRPYTPEALVNLQQQLYDLQLFSTVLVAPTEDSRGKPQVDVMVRVSERSFRMARAGGGFTQETAWQEVYGNVGWSHNYFQKHLLRFNSFAQFGWAFSPHLASPDAYSTFVEGVDDPSQVKGRNGAVADARLGFTLPDFRARQVNVDTEARFLIGQTKTYGYASPQYRFSVSRPVLQNLNVRLGLGVEHYLPYWDALSQHVFNAGEVGEGIPGTTQEGTIRFRGLLTYLEQLATYDKRDNILSPQKGFYASLGIQEAGLLGNFSFIKVQPEVRGYYPAIPDWLVVAGRLQTGLIFPLRGTLTEPDAYGAPPVLQFETGGGSSVRGFGRDQITWYTGVQTRDEQGNAVSGCASPTPVSTGRCDVETGGTVLYVANAELRVPIGQIAVVGFMDAGQVKLEYDEVLATWAGFEPSGLLVGVGGGIRYRTPIGPIRLDFGYRLRDIDKLDPGLAIIGNGCRCALHLGIGEAF